MNLVNSCSGCGTTTVILKLKQQKLNICHQVHHTGVINVLRLINKSCTPNATIKLITKSLCAAFVFTSTSTKYKHHKPNFVFHMNISAKKLANMLPYTINKNAYSEGVLKRRKLWNKLCRLMLFRYCSVLWRELKTQIHINAFNPARKYNKMI